MLCHDHLVVVNGNLSAKQNDVIISNLFFGPKSQCVDQGGGGLLSRGKVPPQPKIVCFISEVQGCPFWELYTE